MDYPIFYYYSVTWFYDNKSVISQGFLLAHTFSQVVEKLEESFDDIEAISIEPVNDNDLLDYEDILAFLNPNYKRESSLGPQIITALQEAINQEQE